MCFAKALYSIENSHGKTAKAKTLFFEVFYCGQVLCSAAVPSLFMDTVVSHWGNKIVPRGKIKFPRRETKVSMKGNYLVHTDKAG
ncbi:hypothetical protein JCM10003_32 [Bacteroides pyogenes JCM 10003]|nr:hypothetical protein JCM10003_32 [Bacteroides pyogenes JCM 10003]